MDVIVVVLISIYTILAPLILGSWWFVDGIGVLVNFDNEFDEIQEKHTAILNTIFGGVLLLFQYLFFWFVIWPFVVSYLSLNLPTLDNILLLAHHHIVSIA